MTADAGHGHRVAMRARAMAARMGRGARLALLVAVMAPPGAAASVAGPGRADFKLESTSLEARKLLIDRRLRDNGGLSFVVADKISAKAFIFNPDGACKVPDALPGCVGMTRTWIDAQLGDIRPEERTTPAAACRAGP
jgi:hypothetical protein